jgi:hypothetical protein
MGRFESVIAPRTVAGLSSTKVNCRFQEGLAVKFEAMVIKFPCPLWLDAQCVGTGNGIKVQLPTPESLISVPERLRATKSGSPESRPIPEPAVTTKPSACLVRSVACRKALG